MSCTTSARTRLATSAAASAQASRERSGGTTCGTILGSAPLGDGAHAAKPLATTCTSWPCARSQCAYCHVQCSAPPRAGSNCLITRAIFMALRGDVRADPDYADPDYADPDYAALAMG